MKGNEWREFVGKRAVASPAAAKAQLHSGASYLGQAWVAKQERRGEASSSVPLNGWQVMHSLSLCSASLVGAVVPAASRLWGHGEL